MKNVYDAGWNAIKLYFMVGLPCETEEDLQGIVDLSRRVLSLARRGGGKQRKVNVSVSTFVPKAHTPFQWVPQIGQDEMREKQEFLKQEIRRLGLNFKWQNVSMSYLEGIFSRGDRRLSKVIEKAWLLGCRFDAWSDQFEWDNWKQALGGIDEHFYTVRNRGKDEIFPWDHINTGVERSFLWEEYQRGLAGDFTPDCRVSICQQCGVCPGKKPPIRIDTAADTRLNTHDRKVSFTIVPGSKDRLNRPPVGYHRKRMKFAKLGKGRFLSHL